MQTMHQLAPIAVMAIGWLGLTPAATAQADLVEGYPGPFAITSRIASIDDSYDNVRLDLIGATDRGRGLFLLTLSSDPETAHQRPALLITAGIDAEHLVGTETAMQVAEGLARDHADLLDDYTVYVIPRVNADGAIEVIENPGMGLRGSPRPIDNDRDGVADEDGPVDLNGDGLITMMRRLNPPLSDPATHLADPADGRLLKTPNAGELATFTLYTEGLDQDGDGLIAEDGPGFVDLNRNFMHGWQAWERDAGRFPASEPETVYLTRFVLDHPNIVAAITYGLHDNLVNVPDGKGTDITGQAPKVIDGGDVSLYKDVAELFKEHTGLTRSPKRDVNGSFHAWLYAQRGIPSFATVVWVRPDVDAEGDTEDAAAGAGGPADTEIDPIEGEWGGTVDVPDLQPVEFTLTITRTGGDAVDASFSSMMGAMPLEGTFTGGVLNLEGNFGEASLVMSFNVSGNTMAGTATGPDGEAIDIAARRDAGTSDTSNDAPASASNAEEAAWLAYFDEERDGAGFVDWTPFDHPTLGAVEIGGFAPLARVTPPAAAVADLVEGQASFAAALIRKAPRLTVTGPEVTTLAPGLWEIRLAVTNDGDLPTATAMARKARAVLPTIIRISTDVDAIVTGERIARVWGIDGRGGRTDHRWVIRAAAGSDVEITISNVQLGDRVITITLGE